MYWSEFTWNQPGKSRGGKGRGRERNSFVLSSHSFTFLSRTTGSSDFTLTSLIGHKQNRRHRVQGEESNTKDLIYRNTGPYDEF